MAHHRKRTTDDGYGDESVIKRLWRNLVKNRLQVICMLAVVLGFAFGVLVEVTMTVTDNNLQYIHFPADMLMNMLQMICIPLVVPSIISGVSRLSLQTSRKTALHIILYVMVTNTLALANGLFLVNWIKPGKAQSQPGEEEQSQKLDAMVILRDFIGNLIPRNFISTSFSQIRSEVTYVQLEDGSEMVQLMEVRDPGCNLLGLIIWSVVVGLLLDRAGQPGQFILDSFSTIGMATKSVVGVILRFLPLGVFFMIVGTVVEVRDWSHISKMAMFILTFFLGFFIHTFILLPLLLFLCIRRNAYVVMKKAYPALLTAFIISSSSATFPQTLKCCEKFLRIDSRLTRFMLPIVTTTNMNGSTFYELIAAVFVTQMNAIDLKFTNMITICLVSLVSTFGASGIPATGASTTFFILSAAGLPIKNTSLLVTVEWLLDRFITVTNVLGDIIGVFLIEQLSKKDLEEPGLVSIPSLDWAYFNEQNIFLTESGSYDTVSEDHSPI